MMFIKISINEKLEQIISIDNIYQIIKGEDYIEGKYIPSYTLILKNSGSIKITENVYKQITKKIKDFIL